MRHQNRNPQLPASTPLTRASSARSSSPLRVAAPSLTAALSAPPVVSSLPRSAAYPFPFQRLDAYRAALELASRVHHARIADAELRDQAGRAAKSVFLNLCEGLPDDRPGVRRRHFGIADGSLHETAGAVDLACAIGALGEAEATAILAVAGRLRAMLRGLMRP